MGPTSAKPRWNKVITWGKTAGQRRITDWYRFQAKWILAAIDSIEYTLLYLCWWNPLYHLPAIPSAEMDVLALHSGQVSVLGSPDTRHNCVRHSSQNEWRQLSDLGLTRKSVQMEQTSSSCACSTSDLDWGAAITIHNLDLYLYITTVVCTVDIEGSVIVTMGWRSWGYDVYPTLFVIVKRRWVGWLPVAMWVSFLGNDKIGRWLYYCNTIIVCTQWQ